MLKRKILCVLFLIIFSVTSLVAQQTVAMRCLEISKDFLSRSEWTNACVQAELGTVYDDSISDLWYIAAEAKYRSGQIPAQVLPLVVTALEKNNWIDVYKDNARLLYARLLCDTNNCLEALEQLDSNPMLYSAEAEYIRALSYYRLGTDEGYEKAREKIAVVSKLFPDDNRFPLLFFTQELKADLSYDEKVAPLAKVFVKRFVDPSKSSVELSIYAAAFAEKDLQERMLNSFEAIGLRHPMFAPVSLKAGILTESEAYEYFCSYAMEKMTIKSLIQFTSMLKTAEVKEALKTFLMSYNGILLDDVYNDNRTRLVTKYVRGRPQFISYDENLDGILEWNINCDFGEPLSISFPKNNISIYYKNFPYLESAQIDDISYSFVADSLKCTPIFFDVDKKLSELLGSFNFIIPKPLENSFELDKSDLLNYSYSISSPNSERPEGEMHISIIDGVFQQIHYLESEKKYAILNFVKGLPDTRVVDMDNDGYFELTEKYSFSEETYKDLDYYNVYSSLFGSFDFIPGVFLQSISVDLNCDTRPDFVCEYAINDEKTLSWYDSNGNKTAEYLDQPMQEKSKTSFYLSHPDKIITVEMEKKIPVSVFSYDVNSKETKTLLIFEVDGVFWVGTPALPAVSNQLKTLLDKAGVQGHGMISSYKDEKEIVTFTAVKIDDIYFGVVCE